MNEGPRLVRDDPEWMMPGRDGENNPRRLRLFTDREGELWAVVTQRGPGISVTNFAEHVHQRLGEQFPGARVIEHYPPRGSFTSADTFDEITVTPDGEPHWRTIKPEEMIAILGPNVLDDMPELPPDPDEEEFRRQRDEESRQHVYAGPALPDKAVIVGRFGTEVTIRMPRRSIFGRSEGDVLGALEHHVKHSPDGFAWGYGGSGPSELARCILIAVLGETARCPECAGTTEVYVDATGARPFRPGDSQDGWSQCFNCDCGNAKVGGLYQQFKDDYVLKWPQDAGWEIRVGAVREWIADRRKND